MGDSTEQTRAVAQTTGHRVSNAVVDKRVSIIAGWLIQGHRNRTIWGLVSESTKLEAKRRADATADKPAPPFVWGDIDPPCSNKQIDRYIARARKEFEITGRQLPKQAAEALGTLWERSNDLYWRALADKRYSACAKILRDQLELFGLVGAIKFQLVDAPAAGDVEPSNVPETEHTEAQLAAQLRELVALGIARVRANPEKYRPLQLPPGAPVTVTDAPADHDDDEEAGE